MGIFNSMLFVLFLISTVILFAILAFVAILLIGYVLLISINHLKLTLNVPHIKISNKGRDFEYKY